MKIEFTETVEQNPSDSDPFAVDGHGPFGWASIFDGIVRERQVWKRHNDHKSQYHDESVVVNFHLGKIYISDVSGGRGLVWRKGLPAPLIRVWDTSDGFVAYMICNHYSIHDQPASGRLFGQYILDEYPEYSKKKNRHGLSHREKIGMIDGLVIEPSGDRKVVRCRYSFPTDLSYMKLHAKRKAKSAKKMKSKVSIKHYRR